MIKGFAKIEGGFVVPEPALNKLISESPPGRCEVMIVPYDKPHHWLHEYYRGYLIPDICNHIGDPDEATMHWFFKTKFLMVKTDDLNNIPAKHRKTARIIRRCKESVDYATGQVIESLEFYEITFSTGSITGREFREYISKVEMFLMDFLGGRLSKRTEDEGMQYRIEGFKDE